MTLFENLAFLEPLQAYPYAYTVLQLAGLALAAWLANWLTRMILVRVVTRVVQATPMRWDDALMSPKVLARLANIVPALIIASGIAAITDLPAGLETVVRNVAWAFVVLTIALAISNVLDAINDLYVANNCRANERPIKGYLQVLKIVVFVFALVVMVATLIERSPLLLLSGFGAMSAVLMLVFKDTILSLVASVQLSSNDMLRVGDWIEMPSLQADGDVIDMALNTVKVQNWDKTVTTIPTYRLISDSFKNWRGMQESGGRRIKRSLLIDQSSVRFLEPEERSRLRRIALIDEYLDDKRHELEAYNENLLAKGKDPVNTRRVTNIGTFRAYVYHYLRAHPGIHQDMTLLVRQLEPGATGLPLELYCFTNSVAWAVYENTQSDIFDHLIAMLPEFGLRLYQAPSGADVSALVTGRQSPTLDAIDPGSGTKLDKPDGGDQSATDQGGGAPRAERPPAGTSDDLES
ncbi:mechanosensitive ion channel family protein [Novilysobacter avium]|uniref:mechanosensitive ion channel family protein n=1 Tax=Novilysobacter avium TaxID=2781023 RepID=UPI001D162FD6|nr:mechanosensitive ion channel family protein [Lysobacter avium]